jgi:hypothetical protein
MTQKIWQVDLEDGKHEVVFDHGFFSGGRLLRVDGQTILDISEIRNLLFDTGGVHEFNIGSHPCAVIIYTNGITFNYDLAVDGRSITTGQPIDSIQPLPAWVWLLITGIIYICVCLAVFVIPLLIILY